MLSVLFSPIFAYSLLFMCLALILFSHIIGAFCKRKFAKTMEYIAIGVHLPLLLALWLLGAELQIVLLVFSSLLLLYLLFRTPLVRAACAHLGKAKEGGVASESAPVSAQPSEAFCAEEDVQ